MHTDLQALLTIAAIAVTTALTGLMFLVRRDLAPAAAILGGGGRLALGTVLGSGIITFTLKVAVMLILAGFPARTMTPLVAGVGTGAAG